jgi:hypothetical protein
MPPLETLHPLLRRREAHEYLWRERWYRLVVPGVVGLGVERLRAVFDRPARRYVDGYDGEFGGFEETEDGVEWFSDRRGE